jgi:hypothetical protein
VREVGKAALMASSFIQTCQITYLFYSKIKNHLLVHLALPFTSGEPKLVVA